MTISAWLVMLTTFFTVTSFTLYFFGKVLRTPTRNQQAVVAPAEGIGIVEEAAGRARTRESPQVP